LHRSRSIGLAGIAISAVALALPFVTVTGLGTIGGVAADAWPALIPGGALALVTLTGDRREAPATWVAAAGCLLGAGMLAFALVKLADARTAVAEAGGSLGVGAWVMVAGAGIALVGAAAGFSRRL
jgi:hypothetical protein